MARYYVNLRKNPDGASAAQFGPFDTKKAAQAAMKSPNVQACCAPGSILTLDVDKPLRPSRPKPGRRAHVGGAVVSNPWPKRTKAPVDHEAARELEMFIDNDYTLYNRSFLPIVKNLQTKIKRGKLDPSKVAKAFLHLADEGAKRYTKAFDGRTGFGAFNKPTREFVAAEYASEFMAEPYAHGTLTNPSAEAHRASAAKMQRKMASASDPFDKAYFRGALAAHLGDSQANPRRKNPYGRTHLRAQGSWLTDAQEAELARQLQMTVPLVRDDQVRSLNTLLTWTVGNDMWLLTNFVVNKLREGRPQDLYIDTRQSGKKKTSRWASGVGKREATAAMKDLRR